MTLRPIRSSKRHSAAQPAGVTGSDRREGSAVTLGALRCAADPAALPQRHGITLYEVVLSLAILLVSLGALGQLISTGSRAAIQSRLKSEATLLCQSKLSEILAGFETMQPVSGVSFDEASSEWVWDLEVAEGPHPDLLLLQLTVSHIGEGGQPDASSSIRRYVRDPQVFLDAAAFEAEIEQQANATGGAL